MKLYTLTTQEREEIFGRGTCCCLNTKGLHFAVAFNIDMNSCYWLCCGNSMKMQWGFGDTAEEAEKNFKQCSSEATRESEKISVLKIGRGGVIPFKISS